MNNRTHSTRTEHAAKMGVWTQCDDPSAEVFDDPTNCPTCDGLMFVELTDQEIIEIAERIINAQAQPTSPRHNI